MVWVSLLMQPDSNDQMCLGQTDKSAPLGRRRWMEVPSKVVSSRVP